MLRSSPSTEQGIVSAAGSGEVEMVTQWLNYCLHGEILVSYWPVIVVFDSKKKDECINASTGRTQQLGTAVPEHTYMYNRYW